MILQAADQGPPPGEEIPFLHRMDSVRGEGIVVATDRLRLSGASFLDGRERFWSGETLAPLAPQPLGPSPARRFVFHVGFCGSTLLARLLDRPGDVLALREPQCLADIAGQRELIASGRAIAPLDALLDHALGRLGDAGEPDLAVVVKPSNWVNPLLPQLCAPERGLRAVFVSMDRRAFLAAVFRGGRPRIEFCTRLAAQVAAVLPRGNATLVEAIERDGDALDRAARIAALLHALQENLFARAIAGNGWSEDVRIGFEDLVARPDATLRRARAALDLGQPADDPQRAAQVMERHTKDPTSAFRPVERLRENREVEREHGARFDSALAWLEAASDKFT